MSHYPSRRQIMHHIDKAPIEMILGEYDLIVKKVSSLTSMQRRMVEWKVAQLVKKGIIKVDNGNISESTPTESKISSGNEQTILQY